MQRNKILGKLKGYLSQELLKDGSAEAAGMKENDVIVKFDGQDVILFPNYRNR